MPLNPRLGALPGQAPIMPPGRAPAFGQQVPQPPQPQQPREGNDTEE
jgi:hypothetical protein